jgi:hypothetical protein
MNVAPPELCRRFRIDIYKDFASTEHDPDARYPCESRSVADWSSDYQAAARILETETNSMDARAKELEKTPQEANLRCLNT